MQAENHRIPIDIDYGHKTQAHWAYNPAGKAIVFVHGFGGESVATWTNFSDMLRQEPLCSGHDIIFLGYDGLYAQAEYSAILLYNFLDALFRDPLSIINPGKNQKAIYGKDFNYKEIILIAHSLGAIISRRALLIAHQQKNPWVYNTKMVLFAPADSGVKIINLSRFLAGALGLGYGLWDAKTQVIEDLERGSKTLKKLLNDSEKVIKSGKGSFAIAKKVIWAEKDNIVWQERFADDPMPTLYKDRTHTDACRPCSDFTDPLKDVIEVII